MRRGHPDRRRTRIGNDIPPAGTGVGPGGDNTFLIALRQTAAGPVPTPLEPFEEVRVTYFDNLIAGHSGHALTFTAPQSHDINIWFHTGGTTGASKLAGHTHANEVADAWMLAANSDLPEDSVGFSALPLFHVNALVVTVLSPLF